MVPKSYSEQIWQRAALIILAALLVLWGSGPTGDSDDANVQGINQGVEEILIRSEPVVIEARPIPAAQPDAGEEEKAVDWFVIDEESTWSDQEVATVEQIITHTWLALETVGLDGESLLAGYRFRRMAGEFIPSEDRFLAMVDHQKKEIILADGAFKRLNGFYIYHELGHAIDRQLDRLPSEAYHQMSGQGPSEAHQERGHWETATGFWLRYHGRDDREEATADAIAWWVMAQAGQPQPFFPGTPVETDYGVVGQTIEGAMQEAAATGFSQPSASAG
jgi:hypothetical protein